MDQQNDATIHFRPTNSGRTHVDLMVGGRSVSRAYIIPQTIRLGVATIALDSIGDVSTDEDCRNRGYARVVLDAAVHQMRHGTAALSWLYGISDFYPKFGYATVGAEYGLFLTHLEPSAPLPAGYSVRPLTPHDLPRLQQLYAAQIATAVGAVIRPADSPVWTQIAQTAEQTGPDECRLVVGPDGQVVAYAWRGKWLWSIEFSEGKFPDNLHIAEVIANGPGAADAVLAACRQWAAEENAHRPVKRVSIGIPPEGPVAAAASYQFAEAAAFSWRCGGPMVRLLDAHRLLTALLPELNIRFEAAALPFSGTFRINTGTGSATLAIAEHGITIMPGGDDIPSDITITIPQTVLARLALGAFPPEDLIARLESPLDERAAQLIAALFPRRHPYMYLADRP